MVEKWLLKVQEIMIKSLCDVTIESVEAYPTTPRAQWVLDWPGQIVIAVSTIYWTRDVNDAIINGTMKVSQYHTIVHSLTTVHYYRNILICVLVRSIK